MNVRKMVIVVGILATMMAVGVDRSYGTTPGECTGYTTTIDGCTWYIEKWADQPRPLFDEPILILSTGQKVEVNYVVTVIGSGSCPAVDVSDTYSGPLGPLTAGETPKQFGYIREIGPYDTCGDYTVENTASLSSAGTPAFDLCFSWTIPVHVPCEGGCTLTQGYWKNHSGNKRAYDDTWEQIGASGARSTFFLSGMTFYEVLREPPRGNPYFILARQYIAAKLNTLKGASTPSEVAAAIVDAEAFFGANVPGATLGKPARNALLIKASILDSYNNGYTGPGHCSEAE